MLDKNDVEVGLGDIVDLGFSDGYGTATVTQTHEDGTVDLFRPYVHMSDFSVAGRNEKSSRLMHYLGYEEIRNVNVSRLNVVRKNLTPIR